jgi:negative regulator of flagellin synthesis FlgM
VGVVMVNNIKNGGVNGGAVYQSNKQQLDQVKKDSATQAGIQQNVKGAEKDSVALTPQVKQLKELQKKIGEADGFDRKKVEEIKKAISDGEYKIDYDKLASKLADFEFNL